MKFKRNQPGKTKAFHVGKISCAFCKEAHHIQSCESFLKLNSSNRMEKVRTLKLCTNCLRLGYFAKNCSFGTCNGKHNTLLHFDRNKVNADKGDTQMASSIVATMCAMKCNSTANKETNIILATALVNVSGQNGMEKQARAFIDSCSQSNFITRSLYNKLKLEATPVKVQIGVLGQLGPNVAGQCTVKISSR